jgi:hypothetical protein
MKALTISEKLNFERTGAPIKKMGIGTQVEDQKILDETDWAIDLEKHAFLYDIVVLIRDYRGYPILVLKNKSQGSWQFRAISRVGVFGDYQPTPEQALINLKRSIDKEIQKENDSWKEWEKNKDKMRGKPLKEDINFERGGESLDKLRIGKKYQWDMTSEELAIHIIEDIEEKVKPVMAKIELAVKKAGFRSLSEYNNYVLDQYDKTDSTPSTIHASKEIDIAEKELEDLIKIEVAKYPFKEGINNIGFVIGDLFSLMLEGGAFMTHVDIIKGYLDKTYLKESQNFERGQEPIKSLQIGQMALRINKFKQLEKALEEQFPGFLREPIVDDDNYIRKSIQVSPYVQGGSAKGIVNQWLRKNLPEFRISRLQDVGYIKHDVYSMEIEWKYDNLEESINFERGQEPIKSMGIGQTYLDKKLIQEIDWGLADNFMEVYRLGTFIRNYKGFPILIIISDAVGGIMAVTSDPGLRSDWKKAETEALQSIKGKINARDQREKRLIKHNTMKESVNFERGGDPIRSMDIGMFHFDVEFSGDIENMEDDERAIAKRWNYNGVKITHIEGEADEDSSELYINLSDGDYIEFTQKSWTGPSHDPNKTNYAKISVKNSGVKDLNVFDEWLEELSAGSIIRATMRMYEDIKDGKMKTQNESLDFERHEDPFKALKIGREAQAESFKKFIEDYLKWNGAEIIINEDGSFTYYCYPGQSVRREILEAIHEYGEAGKYKVKAIDLTSRGDPDGEERHEYLISPKASKARKVNENVYFQREGDPLDTLQIGDIKGRKIQHDKELLFSTLHDMADKFGTGIVEVVTNKKSTQLAPDAQILQAQFKSNSKITYGAFLVFEAGLEIPHYVYYFREGEDEIKTWCKDITAVINELEMKVIRLESVTEAANFTRVGTPQKQMSVGQTAIDKNIIDNTPWNINELVPNWRDEYRIIEVIRDYKGEPILVLENHKAGNFLAIAISRRSFHHGDPKTALAELKEFIDEDQEENLFEAVHFNREGTPLEKMDIGSEDQREISKMDRFAKEFSFEKSGLSGTEYTPEDGYIPIQKWIGPKGQWIVLEKQLDDKHTLKYWVAWKGWEWGKDNGLARSFTDSSKNWEFYFNYPLA